MKNFKNALRVEANEARYRIQKLGDCIQKLESIGLVGISKGSHQESGRHLAMRRYYNRLSDITEVTENLTKVALCGQNELWGYIQDLKDCSESERRPVQLQQVQKDVFELKVKISIEHPEFFLNNYASHYNTLKAYTVHKLGISLVQKTLLVGKEETIDYHFRDLGRIHNIYPYDVT